MKMTPEVKRHTNVGRRSPKIAQNKILWAFLESGEKIVLETSQTRKKISNLLKARKSTL
jgi:hypothetical protein